MSVFDVSLWSFDFDGCLCHQKVLDVLQEKKLTQSVDVQHIFIKENEELVRFVRHVCALERASLTVVLNGSNRQSADIDDCMRPRYFNLSVFDILPSIANAVRGALDAFLLPDVFCGLTPGETWRLVREQPDMPVRPGAPLDDSKILLLFSQMQYAAKRYGASEKTMALHFVDDRLEIMNELSAYCRKNPQMIPKRMTLCLHHYNGERVVDLSRLEGTLPRDDDYERTTRGFTYATRKPVHSGWGFCTDLYRGISSVAMPHIERFRACIGLPIPVAKDVERKTESSPNMSDWLIPGRHNNGFFSPNTRSSSPCSIGDRTHSSIIIDECEQPIVASTPVDTPLHDAAEVSKMGTFYPSGS